MNKNLLLTPPAFVGQTFGLLRVVALSHRDAARRPYYVCLCQCGNTTTARMDNLTSGRKTSCGCGRASRATLGQGNQMSDPETMIYIAAYETAPISNLSPTRRMKIGFAEVTCLGRIEGFMLTTCAARPLSPGPISSLYTRSMVMLQRHGLIDAQKQRSMVQWSKDNGVVFTSHRVGEAAARGMHRDKMELAWIKGYPQPELDWAKEQGTDAGSAWPPAVARLAKENAP